MAGLERPGRPASCRSWETKTSTTWEEPVASPHWMMMVNNMWNTFFILNLEDSLVLGFTYLNSARFQVGPMCFPAPLPHSRRPPQPPSPPRSPPPPLCQSQNAPPRTPPNSRATGKTLSVALQYSSAAGTINSLFSSVQETHPVQSWRNVSKTEQYVVVHVDKP